MSSLGEHSPALKALALQIESEDLSSKTPPPDSSSKRTRRSLEAQLDAESEREETKDLDIVPEEPTMEKLQKIKDFLESEEAQGLFEGADLDLDVLIETLEAKPKIHFDDTAPRRSSGRRQSMQSLQSSAIKQSNRFSLSHGGKQHAEQKTDEQPDLTGVDLQSIIIGGRKITIREAPKDSDGSPPRLFDKTTRDELDAKDRQAFVRYATNWVLPKTNKLALYSFGSEDSGTIRNIRNLQSQLKKLRRHFESYDIDDVFNIVTPAEVDKSHQLVDPTHISCFKYVTNFSSKVNNAASRLKIYIFG